MKRLLLKTMLLLCALVVGSSSLWATDKTLTFVQTSTSAGTLSGDIPTGVTATFNNTYTGNKEQLTAGKSMTLTLSGFASTTTIKGVTLEVKNNKSSGNGTATVKVGSTSIGTLSITGLGSKYQEKAVTITPTLATADVVITIEATANSVYCDKFIITYEEGGLPSAGLAFAVPSYKVVKDIANFPTPTLTNPHNVTVTYSSNDDDIATVIENSGEVLIGSKIGTATITASFAGNSSYAEGSATYTITTYDPAANDGSEAKPYTVAEALTKIAALENNGTIPAVYVKGKVHEVISYNDNYKSITYYIEDLDDNTKTLYVYGGKGLGNTDFTAETDLSVGDEVMLYGALQKYVKNSTTTPEFTSNNYIAQYKHGSEPEVKSLEVKAAEYRTYVASANLVVPTGVKAYIATGESETTLTLKSVAKIKKDSPVILNATAGYYSFEITDEAVDYGTDTNLLQISDGTVTNGVFVLAKINDQVGFYKWAGGALSPGKVYVEAPSSTAREFLGFEVENDVTGINDVKGEKKVVDGIFDLQGRKVITPSKGLYIMNGKKVVIK